MDWGELGNYAKWLFGAWLLILMGFVALRMVSGQIILTGLLRLEKEAPFGFDRLQLVVVTLFFAGGYVIAALARGPGDNLPNIPTPLLLILIGSQGTYLAVKLSALRGVKGRGS